MASSSTGNEDWAQVAAASGTALLQGIQEWRERYPDQGGGPRDDLLLPRDVSGLSDAAVREQADLAIRSIEEVARVLSAAVPKPRPPPPPNKARAKKLLPPPRGKVKGAKPKSEMATQAKSKMTAKARPRKKLEQS